MKCITKCNKRKNSSLHGKDNNQTTFQILNTKHKNIITAAASDDSYSSRFSQLKSPQLIRLKSSDAG
jgi:hypothetical protein